MTDSVPTPDSPELLALTARIVAAHVTRNPVPADALPALILSVHGALANLGAAPVEEAQLKPAVPVKRSVQQDYLVCLEDGAKVTMLKRYIQRRYNLTPDAYRAKWGLPSDYPMVAPAYAARRSSLAKEVGLGRRPRVEEIAEEIHEGPAEEILPMEPDAAPALPEEPVAAETAPMNEDLAPDDEPETRHTAESVFANFGATDSAAGPGTLSGKPKRKRFSDEMTRGMPGQSRPARGRS